MQQVRHEAKSMTLTFGVSGEAATTMTVFGSLFLFLKQTASSKKTTWKSTQVHSCENLSLKWAEALLIDYVTQAQELSCTSCIEPTVSISCICLTQIHTPTWQSSEIVIIFAARY